MMILLAGHAPVAQKSNVPPFKNQNIETEKTKPRPWFSTTTKSDASARVLVLPCAWSSPTPARVKLRIVASDSKVAYQGTCDVLTVTPAMTCILKDKASLKLTTHNDHWWWVCIGAIPTLWADALPTGNILQTQYQKSGSWVSVENQSKDPHKIQCSTWHLWS